MLERESKKEPGAWGGFLIHAQGAMNDVILSHSLLSGGVCVPLKYPIMLRGRPMVWQKGSGKPYK